MQTANSSSSHQYYADVAIAGGGLAGIATALELLNNNKKVLLLERGDESLFGGLAKASFGGMFFVNTPLQRRSGIKDSASLALSDWLSFAQFNDDDFFPRKWAEQYIEQCTGQVYEWLRNQGVGFFPVVHWVERGLYRPGNSVPRFHMVWGTGHGLIKCLADKLFGHKNAKHLQVLYRHSADDILFEHNRATALTGTNEASGKPFAVKADAVVIASGGICGNLELVRRHWWKPWGSPPDTILNGAHPYADGRLHDAVAKRNANITHLDRMWLYAAGIHHPSPKFEGHGLSIVPPKSALWVNAHGERFGPMPLVSGYDTRFLVEQICSQPEKYSWQIMNRRIALRELAISGAEFNDSIRNKSWTGFLATILFGNKKLYHSLTNNCKDVVVADSVEGLAEGMNRIAGNSLVNAASLKSTIQGYDGMIDRGYKFFNDEQLRRIAHLRQYRGDRARTLKFQKIVDLRTMPLIAIREFILSRKSLGGIQTDLLCRVLFAPENTKQSPIEGLYAVGEAAGFGGGGMHGHRSLEGTFLGGCVLTGRIAAKAILGKKLE